MVKKIKSLVRVRIITTFMFLCLIVPGALRSQDFWQQTNGPYGGPIYALAASPSGSVFAGVWQGVFRTTDNGRTWGNSGLVGTHVFSLAITSSGYVFAGGEGGVFRSTDNGGSWTTVNTGLPPTYVRSLAITLSGYVFAGTDIGGVYRSTDNGGSWTAVNTGLTTTYVRSLAITSSGYVFAGMEGGVFRSTDNGGSWTAVNSGLINTDIQSLVINSSGYVFAGTGKGVSRSTNNGGSWAWVGLTNTYVYSLAVNSSGYVFAGGDGGVFRSTDNGGSWTAVNSGLTRNLVLSLAITSSGSVFAGTYGGVFRSTDNGGSWIAVNSGLTNTSVSSLAITSSGHAFAGTQEELFRSTDNGGSWTAVNNGLTTQWICSLAVNSTDHVFAGTSGGGVFRSTDNGGTWIAVNSGLTSKQVLSLAVNSTDHVFAGTSGGGVFRSTDNGGTWIAVNSGLTIASVSSLAINSSGHIFAGTYGGVFRSTDNGGSWMTVNSGLTNTDVSSLVITSSGYVFAGMDKGGVFRSTDNGASWTAVIGWLTYIRGPSLAINSSGHVFAGTIGVVFRSTDNGESWTWGEKKGLPWASVLSLAINSSGYVFAGSSNTCVFRSVRSTLSPDPPKNLQIATGDAQVTLRWNKNSEPDFLCYRIYRGLAPGQMVMVDSTSQGISDTVRIETGLANGTTYYFRVTAVDSAGLESEYSNEVIDTPLAAPFTGAATNVSTGTAILNGSVNPKGLPTNAYFEWGTSSTLATFAMTPQQSVGSGTSAVAVSASLSGLVASTTYYYRVVAQNQSETQRGAIQSFTTTPGAIGLSLPANNSIRVPVNTGLSWLAVGGATHYHVQLSTVQTFSSTVFEDTTLTQVTCQLPKLQNNTTYCWRVRAKNVGGYGPYSPIWNFTTVVAAPSSAVTLLLPVDGAGNIAIAPLVSWSAVPTASRYHLQVAVSSNFSMMVVDDSTISTTSKGVGPLLNNRLYYWRVRAGNDGGFGPFSQDWSFITIKKAPPSSPVVLASPLRGATGIVIFPVLSWSSMLGADGYHLQISTQANFATTTLEDTTIVDTVKLVGPLQPNTMYYWRVRAWNEGGSGPFSATWSFATSPDGQHVTPPSGAVQLSLPVNQAQRVSANPNLVWSQLNDATFYHLQISTSQTFSSTVFDDTTLTVTSKQLSSLQNNTTYYWRVRGRNAGGYGPYSPVWSFTTIVAPLAAAGLLSPSNLAVSVSITPTLNWGTLSGVTSYHLQVSASSSLTPTIIDDTALTATSRQVSGLQNSSIYYWRVRGKNDAGYGPFSTTWSFTTIVATPSAVSLVSPSNAAAGISINPILTWSAMTGATNYHLQVSGNPSFAPNLLDDTTLTGTTKQLGTLQNNTIYYWRIRGKNEGGYGPYSLVWSFTTIPVYTQTLPVTTSLTFPTKTKANEYTAQEYRLIGLPGSSDILAKDIVTGIQNEDWEIVWDNGASTDYLKRYDGSNDFKLSTGRAFWIISKAPLSISRTVPSATLNAAQEVEIPVRSGWNLITNPFDKSIPWIRIQTTNGITGAIYSFNGAFNNATTFDPYAGYYFFNGTPSPVLTTLRVPYSSAFGKVTELEQKKEDGWRMVVEVHPERGSEATESKDETIEIGVAKDAIDGLDAFDQRMPRSLAKAGVYFDRPNWDDAYREFGRDIKAESYQLKKWEFTVEGKLLEKKVIHVTGVESIPSTEDVFLVGKDRGLVVDLRGRQEYTFEMVKGKMRFEILVGRRETVDEETKKLMPTEIKVGPNYPNPFNPATIIPIELPKTMGVKIVIYDILGRTIKTVYDGMMESGKHYVRWDGKDEQQHRLASGVYLYRVGLPNKAYVQRMLLLQ